MPNHLSHTNQGSSHFFSASHYLGIYNFCLPLWLFFYLFLSILNFCSPLQP